MAPKHRENPIITKLESNEFKSIFTDELKSLVSLFNKHGYEIRICGGAVRDLIMGMKPKDLDFATTATPDEMKDMFSAENIRMINTRGEKHGTITPRINNKENFEVTTLRIDVVTDGRHAEVQYTTDWLLDANRRDLTINSMFLGLDGSVYDYFYGYDDLEKRRVAFVGNATTRIQEDYLRILRYFRFYGRIALTPDAHEELTLEAIRENLNGLHGISGERIWVELKKILEGNFAGEIMQTIIECGLSPYIGLPQNPNVEELKAVWKRSQKLNLHGITLLVTLIRSEEQVLNLHTRLKLSAYERDLALFLVAHRGPKLSSKDPLLPYQQLLIKSKSKQNHTKEWIIEVLKYNNSPFLQKFIEWNVPKFPVNGAMLKEEGVESGRIMGCVLNELKEFWADNDFDLNAEELLKEIPRIVNSLENKKNRK
ncbi:CCA tRNA nucleotidyltransferase 1, mitochondrial isoform X2 [Onthophagus taurus]|nr:CCA tRNA nucleotidyltransferase 1, mitochondrial isoform X2 [Onthophagus taurus]